MSKKVVNTLTIAIGAALLGSVSVASAADAFQLTDLNSGYEQVGEHGEKGKEGKCGEGKCGGEKGKEGKCGEGKCGGDKDKGKEGKCGEGKCGGAH